MAYLEYTTVSRLRNYLPNTMLTDQQLSSLIIRASRLLDSELGDNIGQQTLTKRIDGYGKSKIILENTIQAVDSIEYYQQGSWRAVDVDHIQGSIIYTKQLLPSGDANIRITYTKGYATVPSDLEAFFHSYCVQLLSLDSYMQGDQHGEIVSKKINGLSISYRTPSEIIDGLTTQGGIFEQSFKNILDTYKNFSLGIG